ncbi:unnamed protein product [Ambrosiozyma monospora]|uniref:Unnamed protein product n=1 Tax=Ambrosiozyma monospora TaxID=43982 RepID=A0ACB5U0M9_AMBMO|nr:unnamed protein product [Ambrosiozyma monospora]
MAFYWALKGAKMDHGKCMLLLERFYESGVGCEVDKERAKYWGKLGRKKLGLKKKKMSKKKNGKKDKSKK